MLPLKIARAAAHVDDDAVLGGEEFGVGHVGYSGRYAGQSLEWCQGITACFG